MQSSETVFFNTCSVFFNTCSRQPLQPLTGYISSTPHTPSFHTYRNHGPGGPSTDQMLATLLDSQNKVVKMVESVSKRMTDLESIVTGLTYKLTENNSLPSSSSSPDERRRLPTTAICEFKKMYTSFVAQLFPFLTPVSGFVHAQHSYFRKQLQRYTRLSMMTNNSCPIEGMHI